MTGASLDLADLADVMADAIREANAPLLARIATLEKRADEIEKSGARFRGVYQRAATYRRGDQATHKGSLWTALADVPDGIVPGENPAVWQLSAKGIG